MPDYILFRDCNHPLIENEARKNLSCKSKGILMWDTAINIIAVHMAMGHIFRDYIGDKENIDCKVYA